jgi:hypothetical protein
MRRTVVVLASIGVFAAIVAGLLTIGSPGDVRVQKLDERRIEDLQQLQFAIKSYWDNYSALPSSLDELHSERRVAVRLADPATSEPYVYIVADTNTYQLCATFQGEGTSRWGQQAGIGDFWWHPAGSHCFEFNVRKSQ